MIQLKDLLNRVYEGKECTRFEYELKGETFEEDVLVTFRRNRTNEKQWKVLVIYDKTMYTDTQVYSFTIDLPRSGLSLSLICETGLRMLKMVIEEELQKKMAVNFSIGLEVQGSC